MMTYETAAKIAAEHAPDMRLDPHVESREHVNVRITRGEPGKATLSNHFSITLPDCTALMEEASPEAVEMAERKLFTDTLDQARFHI